MAEVLLDRFELIGELGRGGMATVWLARDRQLGRQVALKLLHGHLASDPMMQRRLAREVQAARRLRHPHALVAHELHRDGARLFLSMPFHEGETLADRVAQGPLAPVAVERLARELGSALAEAHRQGIVHRDIKPANVMIDESGAAALSDFGMARLTDQATATAASQVLGTAGYSAPETYSGSRADALSDLYAIGVLLYEAASGVRPFTGATTGALIHAQLGGDFVPLGERVPALDPRLAKLVDRLLARAPAERPQSARELLSLLDHPEEAPAPEPRVQRAAPPALRARLPAGRWSVVLDEFDVDRKRRQTLRSRVRSQGLAHKVSDALSQALSWLRVQIGMEQAGPPVEQLLTRMVAGEAGVPQDALEMPPALLAERFVLVAGVDHRTADRFRHGATQLGFQVELREGPRDPVEEAMERFRGAPDLLRIFVRFFVTLWVLVGGPQAQREELPRAFEADLKTHLRPEYRALLAPPGQGSAPAPKPAPPAEEPEVDPSQPGTRAGRLARRARERIALLHRAIREDPELADLARRDLLRTAAGLAATAEKLQSRALALEERLGAFDPDAATLELGREQARATRLRTLAAAGRGRPEELASVEAQIELLSRELGQHEEFARELTGLVNRLLDLGVAAREARLELAGPQREETAVRLVRELDDELAAARQAMQELAAGSAE